MAIQSATMEWASVTLSSNEIWQARLPCYVTADATATTSMNDDSGVYLQQGDAITFASGNTVIFRSNQDAARAIWREPTA